MTTTFLQAVQEVTTRLRISGAGPLSVLNQPAEYRVVASAVAKAHAEIVGSHIDWTFLWTSAVANFATSGGNPVAPAAVSVAMYDEGTFYYDGNRLGVMTWNDYRKQKLSATEQASTGKPDTVVIMPDKRLLAIPYPDASYQVTFDCWINPGKLVNDTDILLIPDDCLDALYDRAKMIWLGDEESPNYAIAQEDYAVSYDMLEDRYWPGKGKSTLAADQEIVVVPE